MAKKTVKRLKRIVLAEVSLVDHPACEKATVERVALAKAMAPGDSGFDSEGLVLSADEIGPLRKFFRRLFGGGAAGGGAADPDGTAAPVTAEDGWFGCVLEKCDECGAAGLEKVIAGGEIIGRVDKANKKPYGDVDYADPGYQADKKKRYPLDTEAHIRAAWSYIGQDKNAKKYTAEQVKSIKAKIVAAWKAKIDKDGPPSAAEKSDSKKAWHADPGYLRDAQYPLDTIEHIVEAWAAVTKFEKGGTDYKPEQLAAMKRRTIAVWKRRIAPEGPPGAAEWLKTEFQKGLYAVAVLAQLVEQLDWLCQGQVDERAREGDDSKVPDDLKQLRDQLGEVLVAMAQEETGELKDGEEGDTAMALSQEAKDYIKSLMERDGGELGEFLSKGRSKADVDKAQKAHDLTAEMGAGDHGSDDDTDKCDEKGNVVKRGRFSKADKDRINSLHDVTKSLGANCDTTKSAESQEIKALRSEFGELKNSIASLVDALGKTAAPIKVNLGPGESADKTGAEDPNKAKSAGAEERIIVNDTRDITKHLAARARQGMPLEQALN